MYARIYDTNISGYLSKQYDELADALEELESGAGHWRDYTGEGVALLSNPSADLFESDPETEEDPYPDYIIELSDIGEALYNKC